MGANEAFAKLNDRQREAATASDGPLLILAGAGTGKTNTLAHRVAHLVLRGVRPERILLLTFTRRAALEMTRRAQRVVGEAMRSGGGAHPELRLPWSGTFHAVANRLIRQHCRRLGLTESFSVLDRGDAADLLDVVRHERGLSAKVEMTRRFPRKDTCLAIYSHRVNTQGALAETLESVFPWCAEWEAELKNLFKSYVDRKLDQQALDYDDLLLYWHAMMQDASSGGRDRRAVRPRARGRVPGHERAAGADPARAAARGRGAHGGGGRRAVDLLVPRGERGEHPGFRRPVPADRRRPAGGELPLHAAGARCGQCIDEGIFGKLQEKSQKYEERRQPARAT